LIINKEIREAFKINGFLYNICILYFQDTCKGLSLFTLIFNIKEENNKDFSKTSVSPVYNKIKQKYFLALVKIPLSGVSH